VPTWVAFGADLYLDARKPEWVEFERLGHVEAHRCGDGWAVVVDIKHCFAMVEAMRQRLAERLGGGASPMVKVPHYLGEIRRETGR
jgi:hypothetical protein